MLKSFFLAVKSHPVAMGLWDFVLVCACLGAIQFLIRLMSKLVFMD